MYTRFTFTHLRGCFEKKANTWLLQSTHGWNIKVFLSWGRPVRKQRWMTRNDEVCLDVSATAKDVRLPNRQVTYE